MEVKLLYEDHCKLSISICLTTSDSVFQMIARFHPYHYTGLEISTRPLAQASVKTTWASRLFVAFIKGNRTVGSAVKIKFPFLSLHA